MGGGGWCRGARIVAHVEVSRGKDPIGRGRQDQGRVVGRKDAARAAAKKALPALRPPPAVPHQRERQAVSGKHEEDAERPNPVARPSNPRPRPAILSPATKTTWWISTCGEASPRTPSRNSNLGLLSGGGFPAGVFIRTGARSLRGVSGRIPDGQRRGGRTTRSLPGRDQRAGTSPMTSRNHAAAGGRIYGAGAGW